jgi:hypothetical protein
MEAEQPTNPEALRDVRGDLETELAEVRARMADLTHAHERAVAMRQIVAHDPLSRERFALLHENIDLYPGRMAELREQERLLQRWLDRCRQLLDEAAA